MGAQRTTTTILELLAVEDIARLLKITPAAARRLFLLGRLPGRKIGRRWWCSRTAFEKWLEGDDDARGVA